MSDDIAKIERSLTRARKEMILSARETILSGEWIMPLRHRWATRVLLGLRSLGLVEDAGVNRMRLTPLGTAVRAHLQEHNHDS